MIYGDDIFTLAEVTDAYKAEWESCSDWLKMAFHAESEFPDYPHIHSTYDEVYTLFKNIEQEVFRFAGEKSFTYATCPHWLPVSRMGVHALYDCGVRLLDVTRGTTSEYLGEKDTLSKAHVERLMHNRQPETKCFDRMISSGPMRSICGYNHFSEEQFAETGYNFKYIKDEETGIFFKKFSTGVCLNIDKLDELEAKYGKQLGREYIGTVVHEQYFYADYFAYQPDYAEKIYKMCEILKPEGYEFIFAEDFIK